jgi:hypothetical protein
MPLANIMSSMDDLRIGSMKVEDVQQLIKEQELKDSHFFWLWDSWTPKDYWHQMQEKYCISIYKGGIFKEKYVALSCSFNKMFARFGEYCYRPT